MRRLILCALLLPAFALPQTAASLSIAGPAAVKNGLPVTVTVSLSNGSGPAGLQWDMNGLPTGATVTSLLASKAAACTTPPTRCLLVSPTTALNVTAIPDGPVATFQYTQGTTPVTAGVVATLGATPAGASLTVTPPTATLTIPLQSPCDLNADGKVDGTDVGLSIQAALASPANGTVLQVIQEIIAANGGACLR